MDQPLEDISVLDFSTLLPGPMATLMLAEAGADIIKVERPGGGEDMRRAVPVYEGKSLGFALLNQGKKSISIDLKKAGAVQKLRPLIEKADVLVEQFRPGVMDRLGLGYNAVKAINPSIIYCSITGYGQIGPKRDAAGHDLNYMGDAGLLSLATGSGKSPALPLALVADVGGGSYPAVMNILLALRKRDKTGKGTHIDVAMTDGVFTFAYWAFAQGIAAGEPIINSGERLTGGSPRYHIYPASDGRLVAVGALEQKFWIAFCDVIGLTDQLRDDTIDTEATITEVARLLSLHPSTHWEPLLDAADCCCTIARTMAEAAKARQFTERALFDRQTSVANREFSALPLPIAPAFRKPAKDSRPAPDLGADNPLFGLDDSE